ncbi:MAG: phosphoribosylanthranilate isomerase [Deltaproteobacteria bacterium]|nr:phosphoribosylanthranilate isomerase [Deltaproteobacteria bacterium]
MKIKICGITSIHDAMTACAYGADALGFVFYRKSPRYISPENAKAIIERIPAFVATVGVFVDEDIERMDAVIGLTGIDYAQLHGNEPASTVHRLGRKAIKAFRIKDESSIAQVNGSGLDTVLLDGFTDIYGGAGKGFDHGLLKDVSKSIRVILAGGITPENVVETVREYGPYAIDVSSGVESSPGKKSEEKLRLLFERIRACGPGQNT